MCNKENIKKVKIDEQKPTKDICLDHSPNINKLFKDLFKIDNKEN